MAFTSGDLKGLQDRKRKLREMGRGDERTKRNKRKENGNNKAVKRI